MIIEPAQRAKQATEYYFSVKLGEVRKLISEGHDVINLGIGNPEMMPATETIDTLIRVAREKDAHGYQPYTGLPVFKEAIARFYKRIYDVNLDPVKEVLPLIGSKEGITHISLTFLDPGDEVLVPELGYPTYRSVSRMTGAEVKEYPLLEEGGWQPDWKTLETLVTPRTKLLWMNYPHMPTGAVATEQLFHEAVDFARSKRVLLVHDNPYSLILNKKKPVSILSVPGAHEVALELNSMSKSHNMAGWRLGWLCGAEPYLQAVLKIKTNIDSGMFRPLQEAAAVALDSREEWHEERNKIYAGRLEAAGALLSKLGCTWDKNQEGLFLWGKLPENAPDSADVVEDLLYNKFIFLAPGFIFGEKGKRYIRISLCTPEARIREAVNRL